MLPFTAKSDARIVRTVIGGRTDQFSELVTRYLPAVHAVAYTRTRNHADAEDVAQETFLKAYRSLDSLREPARFKAWLIGIARNTAASWWESRQRDTAIAERAAEEPQVDEPNPEQRELHAMLWREVDALDESSREVIFLYYQAGQSTKDIAALVNASNDAVRKRLQRAREQLGTRLLDALGGERSVDYGRNRTKIISALAATSAPWLGTQNAAATVFTGATLAKAASVLVVGIVASIGLLRTFAADETPNGTTETRTDAIDAPRILTAQAATEDEEATSGEESNRPEAQAAAHTGVSGYVFDENGTPIPQARVRLFRIGDDRAEVVGDVHTGEDGAFHIEELGSSDHLLGATHDDYLASAAVQVQPPAVDIEIRLERKPDCVAHGQILDAETNRPVSDFTISLGRFREYPLEKHAFSDPTGRYEVKLIAETMGAQHLTYDAAFWVIAEGYQHQFVSFADMDSKGRIERIVRLSPGFQLAGRVIDIAGEPVTGAKIYVTYPPINSQYTFPVAAETAADGTFVIDSVDPQVQRVSATHPDFSPASTLLDVWDGTIVLEAPGGIEGTVNRSGEPLTGVRIGARPTYELEAPYYTETDGDGRFAFDRVPTGPIDLIVHIAEEKSFTERVQGEPGAPVPLAIDIPVYPGRLTGEITFNGRPPANPQAARVTVSGASEGRDFSYTTRAEAGGRYTVDDIPAGTVQVRFTRRVADVTYHEVRTQRIVPGQPTELNADLSSGTGSITVHVDGAVPSDSVMIRLLPGYWDGLEPNLESYRQTLADNMFLDYTVIPQSDTITGLPAGDYTVLVAAVDNEFLFHMLTSIEHARYEWYPVSLGNGEDVVLEVKSP